MAEFESRSVPDPVGAPTMTHGLNDMGQVSVEATLPRPAPRLLPPRQDVIALFHNPSLAERFDAKWGDGLSKQILETYRFVESTAANDEEARDPSSTVSKATQVETADPVSTVFAHVAAAGEAAAYRLRRTVARGIGPLDAQAGVAPDQLPSDVDSNLTGEAPDVLERFRLHAHDSRYRGHIAGAARLGALQEEVAKLNKSALALDLERRRAARQVAFREIVADLARYDVMDPFGTAAEGAAAFLGQLGGSFSSPESIVGIPARGAGVGARIGHAIWRQGLVDVLSDAFVQHQSVKSGVQKDYEWMRSVIALGLGTVTGVVGRTAVEGARHLPGATAPARKGAPDEAPTVSAETPTQSPAMRRLDATAPDSADTGGRLQQWRDTTPNKAWDDHYRTAQRWQDELATAGESIAQETGTRFVNPGIKDRARAEGKPGRQPGYRGPQDVTDVVRGAYMLERPDQADAVSSLLARHFGADNVIDEGWKKSFGGYIDRKIMIRFADGTIGEFQLVEPRIFQAKQHADILYDERRVLPRSDPRYRALAETERQIFRDVDAVLSQEWKSVIHDAPMGN